MDASSSSSRRHDVSGSDNFEIKQEYLDTADDDDDDCGDVKPDDAGMSSEVGGKAGRSRRKGQGSLVWEYFVQQKTSAKCKLCKRVLKCSTGSTTNLLIHLRRTHRKQHAAMMEKYGRRKMEEASRNMVCIL